eukprot:scaffold6113_cov112-Skeletonema_dohrnii-CCMP3373.AAC.5
MITSKEAALPNCHILALFYDADANNVQLNSFAKNSCTEFKRATAWFSGLRYYISKEDDGWPAGDFLLLCVHSTKLLMHLAKLANFLRNRAPESTVRPTILPRSFTPVGEGARVWKARMGFL